MLLTSEDAVIYKDTLYFVSTELNAICSIDLKTGISGFIDGIPEEDLFARELCHKIIAEDDRLILIPYNAKKIWIYELQTSLWQCIELKNENIERKFRQGFIHNNTLFLIGCRYPAIVIIRLNDLSVTYLDTPYIKLQSSYEGKRGYFRHDCIILKDTLYIGSYISNNILCLNLNDLSWEFKKWDNNNDSYGGIALSDNKYFLAVSQKDTIIKWDGNQDFKYYSLSGTKRFNRSDTDQYLCLFEHLIQLLDDDSYIKIEINDSSSYRFTRKTDDGRIIIGQADHILIVGQDGQIETYQCLFPKELFVNKTDKHFSKIHKYVTQNKMLTENDLIGLQQFTNAISL